MNRISSSLVLALLNVKVGNFTSLSYKNGEEMYKKNLMRVQKCCLPTKAFVLLPSRRRILKSLVGSLVPRPSQLDQSWTLP